MDLIRHRTKRILGSGLLDTSIHQYLGIVVFTDSIMWPCFFPSGILDPEQSNADHNYFVGGTDCYRTWGRIQGKLSASIEFNMFGNKVAQNRPVTSCAVVYVKGLIDLEMSNHLTALFLLQIYLPQIIPQILKVFMHDSSSQRSVTTKVTFSSFEFCMAELPS